MCKVKFVHNNWLCLNFSSFVTYYLKYAQLCKEAITEALKVMLIFCKMQGFVYFSLWY